MKTDGKYKARRARQRGRKVGAAGNVRAGDILARLEYFGWVCAICHSDQDITVDHNIPLCRGGSNHPANLWALCRTCNEDKGRMTGTEYLAHLARNVTT